MHRLAPWLAREFQALLGEEHVEFMIQLISPSSTSKYGLLVWRLTIQGFIQKIAQGGGPVGPNLLY